MTGHHYIYQNLVHLWKSKKYPCIIKSNKVN